MAQGRRGAQPAGPVPNQNKDPLLQGFEFRSIGPAVMGGRVDDIVGSDQDPMTMYIGFATGGLWKTTDGGIRWKSMFDEMPNESIGSVAIAPSDKNVVYVGMGEGNNRQSSSIGDGVWGTTDGGEHWTHLGLEDTQSIQRVVVDQTNPKIAFVAAVGHLFGPNTERGLYRTVDGGKTWKKVKYIDEYTGFTDVAIDPSNPKNVYAASYQHLRTWWGYNGGGAGSALWKSTDGGDTWAKLDGPGWPKPKDGIYGRIAISIFRAKPATIYAQVEAGASGGTGAGTAADGGPARGGRGGVAGESAAAAGETQAAGAAAAPGGAAPAGAAPVGGAAVGRGGAEAGSGTCTAAPAAVLELYGGAGGGGGGGGGGGRGRGATPAVPNPDSSGVFRSDDGGKTWNFISNCNERPMYFSQIRVDPVDVNKIFTGGNPGRVSQDGGKTWAPLQGSHTDYHAFWINPKDPRQVWIGHDGGFDSSNDGGVTWDFHSDIAVGQFYQVSADMRRPYWVCGGLQDNNAWCGPSALRSNGGGGGGGGASTGYNGGPVNSDWYTIVGGDGFYTRQDPSDWAIVYGESQDGNMTRHDLRNGTQKSIRPTAGRGGAPAQTANEIQRANVAAGTRPADTPQPAAPDAAAAGGRAGAAAAGGGAGGGGGGRGGTPNVLNAPPNIDALRFYWNAPIEISPHNPAKIYMAAQYFFKSNNRGDTWWMNPTDLSKNVYRWAPEMAIMGVSGEKPMAEKHDGYAASSLTTQIRESPSRPGVIWIGTDDGNLQVSKDDGESFTNVVGNIKGGPVAPHGWVQISRIEPSHFDPGTAYVALDNHRYDDWKPYLFKTTDFGQTWTNVTGNLPVSGNINALREDYDNPNLLFVGTEFGLYVTLDGCKEWKKFMNNLPSVRVDDILIHPRDRDLIVATHGRSIWIADDITPLEQLKPIKDQTSLLLFDPRPAVLWKNDLSASRAARNREFKGVNPQGGTAINVWAKADIGTAKIEFLQGTTVASTMDVDIKAGMNRFHWRLDKPQTLAANAAGGVGGGGGRAGRAGGRGGAAAAADAPAAGAPAAGAAGAAVTPPATTPPVAGAATPAATPDAAAAAAGGQFGGRGGRIGGPVPFIIGGRGGGGGGFGGGGGGPVDPGVYMVRLTIGDKTFTTSVNVLEDIWARPQ
jgi:photosystem II stability/assembly factor-like uncharacterized protein